MDLSKFDNFPDDARLWIYGFARTLGEDEQRLIAARLDAFLVDWQSHRVPVRGAYTVAFERFVLVAGWCESGLSGCSIDSSVGQFKELRREHELDGLDRDLVFFRNESGEIEALDRKAFQEAVSGGRAGADTVVFDTIIQTLGDLRAGRFERAFADSWHARAF